MNDAQPPCGRGVLYIVWNRGRSPKHDAALRRSVESVRVVHPELPVRIHELPAGARLLDKAGMYDWSPFEETVYLDLDTVVLDRLDFGFEKASRHGLCVTIAPASFARRYHRMISGDVVEYNTGVIFWKRGRAAGGVERLFREWDRLAKAEDSSHEFPLGHGRTGRQDCNDQAGFAKSVETTGFCPFVLPGNWNYRPQFMRSFYGPIKVWHEYAEVPPGVRAATEQMKRSNLMYFCATG
jgi:hypothetical protein